MKFTIYFVVTLLVGIVAIIISPYFTVNPGVMSHGHDYIQNSCTKCHSIPGGANSNKCLDCHNREKIGLEAVNKATDFKPNQLTNRLHTHIYEFDCGMCHKEHTGESRANAEKMFTHTLIGAGTRVRCSECHDFQKPGDELHLSVPNDCNTCHETEIWKKGKFNHEMLADQRSKCSLCHAKVKPDDQMHNSFKGENACEICHTTQAWKPSTFKHDEYFTFDKNHPNSCLNCHTADDNYKTYSCYNCHDAHVEEAIVKRHKDLGIVFYKSCVKCHRSGDNYYSDKNKLRKRERDVWKEEMKWAE